jgi:lipoyl(octanoyl) transferase
MGHGGPSGDGRLNRPSQAPTPRPITRQVPHLTSHRPDPPRQTERGGSPGRPSRHVTIKFVEEVLIARPGLVSYQEAWALQRRIEAARQAGEVPDVLLLLEHPPVYTKGKRSDPAELAMGEEWYRMQGIEVCETDRGGRVTYHGPGQLVGYPIISLKPYGDNVHEYVKGLERLMIESLAAYAIEAEVIDGLTGVWVGGRPPEGRKIGSIGVHVNRGVTTHGFAINVNNDLQPFEWIVPCGIEGVRMTSLTRELGAEQDMDRYIDLVAQLFGRIFERDPVDTDRTLAELAGGAAPVR